MPPAHVVKNSSSLADELRFVGILRKVLSDMNPVEAMELLTSRMARAKTNAELMTSMNLV
jgi:transcription termination factor Rho